MIRETRPRSPLVPQVWLERGRAHSLTRQWPLDLLQRATVVAIEDKTRTDRDEGTKGPSQDGVGCEDSGSTIPVPLHPLSAAGTPPRHGEATPVMGARRPRAAAAAQGPSDPFSL